MSFGPRITPTWFKATDRRQEVTVISETTPWVSHWDADIHRSVRCGGARCLACHYGSPRQLRVVVLVVDAMGTEKLFELRERHREAIDRYPSTAGLVLAIRKAGPAKNSPVDIKVIRETLVAARDISRLVDCLGNRPILLAAEEGTPSLRAPGTRDDSVRLSELDEWDVTTGYDQRSS